MRKQQLCILIAAAAAAALPSLVRATTYTDTIGDKWSPAAYIDIASLSLSNDATNLYVTLSVAPGADLTDVNQQYGNYEISIQSGPGGQTLINNDYSGGVSSGNPYGTPVGASTGINTFLTMFTGGGGGGDAYTYDATTGWTHTWNAFQQPDRVALTQTSIIETVPLQYLNLTRGQTIKFDLYSTFSGDNSAYDALQNASQTFSGSSRVPYNNGTSSAAPYDSATEAGSTFNTLTYTLSGGTGPTNAAWNVDADGNWSQASNWSPSAPNAAGAVATFGSKITAPHTVAVDSAQTTGQIVFDNLNKYTIAGTSTLTLDNTSGGVGITVNSGSHDITAPLVLAKDANFNVGTNTLTLTNLQPSSVGITKTGAGTLAVNNLRAGSLTISAGNVAVAAGRSTARTSKVSSLSITAGALDLNDQDMIVDASTSQLGAVKAAIISGYDNGSWNGSGIRSTAALSGFNGHSTALGYVQASSIGTTSFSGQSLTNPNTATLVKYTLRGDGNLDGNVDLTDFTFLAANFNGSGKEWLQGDYNYDGNVDLTDFTFLASNFNSSLPASLGLGAAVPEPSLLVGSAILSIALVRRNRRKTNHPFATERNTAAE